MPPDELALHRLAEEPVEFFLVLGLRQRVAGLRLGELPVPVPPGPDFGVAGAQGRV
jgi:hypothetical protein